MRWFGLDVHRDFCEVAVVDEKGVRSAGRIATRMPTLELFAQSLASGDVVALEATTGADQIVSVLERHAIRVVVANTRKLRSISEAKAKTDRLDAARSPGCSRSACSRRCGRRTSAHGRCGG
jgi:transposase